MSYDALLWLSFGGPEGPDDVRPFLENVTRGRGVPPERLDEVERHYLHFGGVSPINALNRAAIAAVEPLLDLPVYFGNRNWHPLVERTLAEMKDAGVRRALVFPTSAYGGYSACRQYDEDVERARAAVPDAPELVKLRQFFDHPLFVDSFADAVRSAATPFGDDYRLVFTAHSVPLSADAAAGPPAEGGHRYSRQVAEASRLVASQVGVAEYDVVWQSRSGPPQVPWLEPDIVDHLDVLHAKGVANVVVCPIGFVSDHLEVVWDLDTEARDRAAELGLGFGRAATPNGDPRFAQLVAELVAEHVSGAPARKLSDFPAAGCTVNGAPCAPLCCEPARRPAR
ncbi:ferrochelatase [Saccharothrix violaceirubra]|uniref:Coproporphyrin III ferrochelatase n=1 Tax=Saccharothrix violaceirubra TaxID=413306 RepID=A0A7W7WVI3_9PSEU|nr:ferrochelatase [Saccharothrix violaceirubra]MBB4964937.1 ferrochelatase [Saccharothrix violaceirubra]